MKNNPALLAFITVFLLLVSPFDHERGYAEPSLKGEELVLFDGSQRMSGVKITLDPEDAGNQVAFWEHAPKGFRFPVIRTEVDLSEYDALSLRFYSEEADKHEILILCDSNEDGEGNYYLGKFTVDWKGWKTIVIPFRNFSETRNPAGWKKINQIHLANTGYGVEAPNPDAVYYIDDIKGVEK